MLGFKLTTFVHGSAVNSILDMTMVIYDSHEPLTSQLTSDKVHQELSRRLDELDAKFTKHQAFLMLVGSKMDETQMPFSAYHVPFRIKRGVG
jgi:hypothetical protein